MRSPVTSPSAANAPMPAPLASRSSVMFVRPTHRSAARLHLAVPRPLHLFVRRPVLHAVTSARECAREVCNGINRTRSVSASALTPRTGGTPLLPTNSA